MFMMNGCLTIEQCVELLKKVHPGFKISNSVLAYKTSYVYKFFGALYNHGTGDCDIVTATVKHEGDSIYRDDGLIRRKAVGDIFTISSWPGPVCDLVPDLRADEIEMKQDKD